MIFILKFAVWSEWLNDALRRMEQIKNDSSKSESLRQAVQKLHKHMSTPSFRQEWPYHGQTVSHFANYLSSLVTNVPSEKWNTHSEVIPFCNGTAYLIDVVPRFGHGILTDYMVGRVHSPFVENLTLWLGKTENMAAQVQLNKFLFDFMNRKEENLEYFMTFIASGLLMVSPPKLAYFGVDKGGCGKSVMKKLCTIPMGKKYAFFQF